MYVALLLAITICTSQLMNISYKKGTEKTSDALSSPALLCTFISVFMAGIFLALAFLFDGGIFFAGKLSLVYSLACGVAYACAAFFYLAALGSGPYMIPMIVLSLSSFMPILYSYVFLNERVTPFQIISLFIMITACVFLTLSRNRGKSEARANARWFIYIVLTFITNSFFSFFVRVNTVVTPETPSRSLFFVAYIVSAFICFIFFLASGGVKKKIQPKPLILPALCVAAFLSLNLLPNAELPRYLPAALQYPLGNGGAILLGVAVGIVFFKEKLNRVSAVCILAIIASLCMIGVK